MEIEIWKPVPGFEQYYSARNLGRVKRHSITRPMVSKVGNLTVRTYAGKTLSPQQYPNKYWFIGLSKDGEVSQLNLGRLIATIFKRPPVGNEQVNHMDGDSSNNRESNLEWVTPSENILHSYRVLNRKPSDSGLSRRGEKNVDSKKILQCDLQGNVIKEWPSMGEISRELGISQPFVSACCRGINKTAKGFTFKYKLC